MKWKDEALKHAKKESPNESCGLVVEIRDYPYYFPCKNIADNPKNDFIINPRDWKVAADNGKITGVVHSHPVTTALPSAVDKAACEKTKLKWYIVQAFYETWSCIVASNWKQPLIGRQYCWAINDCYSVVRDYFKQELNINLKDGERPASPAAFKKLNIFDKKFKEYGFRELKEKEELRKNDVVLMALGSKTINHVGVLMSDDYQLLHHLENKLSGCDLLTGSLLKSVKRRLRFVFI